MSLTGLPKPKIVVLCGSSRFVEKMAICAWIIERNEGAITLGRHLSLPGGYADGIPDHLAGHEGVEAKMDQLHVRKIDLADEVFVVNVNDYIDESTQKEIAHARKHGKLLMWYTVEAQMPRPGQYKRLVEKQRGWVNVKSGPGKGTVFTVGLPVQLSGC